MASAAAVADLVERLRTIPEGGEPAGRFVSDALLPLLDADFTASYRPDRGSDGWRLGFLNLSGYSDAATFESGLVQFLSSAGKSFALYDPDRPAPEERNRIVRPRALHARRAWSSSPIIREFFRPRRLDRMDQLRVLVCDGPSLLAWVGGFRARSFRAGEMRLLARLQPALTARLRLERQLADARLYWECLAATLESLAAPAYLRVAGRIEFSNRAGTLLLDADRPAVEQTLAAAGDRQISRARIEVTGAPPIELCVVHQPYPELGRRLETAQATWRPTPSELRVLRYLVLGDTNKTIAVKLACAEVTVEYHVTRLLRKAAVTSRGELVARFWTH